MVSQETIKRLRRHAGLDGDENQQESAWSVSWCLASSEAAGGLESATTDLVNVLARLNLELNGDTPSLSAGVAQDIPRDIAYALAEIVSTLRNAFSEVGDTKDSLTNAAWMVETAWLAILAGDVDDIHQHLADEQAMRGDR